MSRRVSANKRRRNSVQKGHQWVSPDEVTLRDNLVPLDEKLIGTPSGGDWAGTI